MAVSSAVSRRRKRPERTAPSLGMRVALGVFASMAVLGPLLFGSVDRIAQVALVTLLCVGLLAVPPAVVPFSRRGNFLVFAFLILLLGKEFAPAGWFGASAWRTILTSQFGLALPPTHNPEPARVFDALLAGVAALIWFLWVRRLAASPENRTTLAWSLFAAAGIVAALSFAFSDLSRDAIFGLRFTPGWNGFGPFPNRNHTGDFFAMGAVIGCGCVTWAAARKRWLLLGSGLILLGLIFGGLLKTESRGGLIAFALGLTVYLALALAKLRNRQALGAAVAAALLVGALALAFGAQVFSRFQSDEAGHVSTMTRLRVWQDAIGMWKDAPLLGHGLDTFAQLFPLYQKIELENQIILHPESSWLQWLTELGLLPVSLGVVGLILFLQGHRHEIFASGRGFFLRAACLAAFFVLLGHAFFDVPAHRWGTAGFALAALAIACPLRLEGGRFSPSRKALLVPLALAIFWALPFFQETPAWSPLTLGRLLARTAVGEDVRIEELESVLPWFPLSADLQQAAGMRKLRVFGRSAPAAWQRHFDLAARLVPSSWLMPVAQARACRRIAPSLAVSYWQRAIARGGEHREDVFRMAVQESASWPLAEAAWGRFAEANPRLLLAYARLVPEPQARYYYALWWKERALGTELTADEVEAFYQNAPRWGSRAQFDEWMTRHRSWEARDYRLWARLLHAWTDEARAWEVLARFIPEPGFPEAGNLPRAALETKWRLSPQNMVNAQQLALSLFRDGDTMQSDAIVTDVAADEHAPPWFVQKAAHILARNGRTGEAVSMLLRRNL